MTRPTSWQPRPSPGRPMRGSTSCCRQLDSRCCLLGPSAQVLHTGLRDSFSWLLHGLLACAEAVTTMLWFTGACVQCRWKPWSLWTPFLRSSPFREQTRLLWCAVQLLDLASALVTSCPASVLWYRPDRAPFVLMLPRCGTSHAHSWLCCLPCLAGTSSSNHLNHCPALQLRPLLTSGDATLQGPSRLRLYFFSTAPARHSHVYPT